MSTMKSAQTVYYGPSTSAYPSTGSVSKNETITPLWTESTWCYIEYSVTGSTNKKRGYVPTSAINLTVSVSARTISKVSRYVHTACSVYFGPNTSTYPAAGSLSYGEAVQYLGVKDSSTQYAFVEYDVTGTSQKKRGWAYANNFMLSPPVSKIFKNPIYTNQNFTDTSHKDYAVVKGTPVYAMCDGTFNAAYWLGKTNHTGSATVYVSLGIGGHLVPASGWKASDGRTSSSIEYGHLSSLVGYSCPSFAQYTESTFPSSSTGGTAYSITKTNLGSKTVKCGDLIGYSGKTGNADGAHLHIQL